MLTDSLKDIIQRCWTDFNNFKNPIKISSSIPILWFGDLEKYRNSKTKILSVALNPSEKEFCVSPGRFSIKHRFPGFCMPFSDVNYYQTLNEYFIKNPYWTWFQSIERILNCMDASYKANVNIHNTAVHIDLYAPVATSPHWNGLTLSEKASLICSFSPYFNQMIDELKPDIILASFSQQIIEQHFRDVNNCPCLPVNAKKTWSPEGKKGIFLRYYDLYGGKKLITGRNMSGTAFGGLTAQECKQGMSVVIM